MPELRGELPNQNLQGSNGAVGAQQASASELKEGAGQRGNEAQQEQAVGGITCYQDKAGHRQPGCRGNQTGG